ncbi:MAG: hypothetical protein WBY61_14770, partial [Terriglobales bacterium]
STPRGTEIIPSCQKAKKSRSALIDLAALGDGSGDGSLESLCLWVAQRRSGAVYRCDSRRIFIADFSR